MRLRPVDEHDAPRAAKRPRRKRRLRRVSTLPTLLTLGNLYFGFAAIYCCGLEMRDLGAGRGAAEIETLNSQFFETRAPSYLAIAFWMIAAAAICDALDGRVARKTGGSSKFGEQLDSLADIVSFGTAPALMFVTLVQRELTLWNAMGHGPPFGFYHFGTATVLVGVLFVCCAGLRLARFTVEASFEEAAHEGFRGLPSPAAASGVVALVYLHDKIVLSFPTLAYLLAVALPPLTLTLALLMVSRIPYIHVVSSALRRRPLGHVILILLATPVVVIYPDRLAVILAWTFVLSGPVRAAWRMIKGLPPAASVDGEQPRTSDDHLEPPVARHAP